LPSSFSGPYPHRTNMVQIREAAFGLAGAASVIPVKESAMADPRDVIYAAIHSAVVKYPKEDDPASHDHWIQPEEATHLTKVVMAELEANGFEIVKRKP